MSENAAPSTPTNGKAVASLVLGIISVVLAWFLWIDLIAVVLGIIGLVLGINARKEQASGMATAGLVLSIIGLALGSITFISCLACASCAANSVPWGAWSRFY